LPPSYEVHLTGLPGFHANVDYSITAIASKSKTALLGIGATTVSTPFIYYPRSRPGIPLPAAMIRTSVSPGLQETGQWRLHESTIVSRAPGSKDIICKLYVPKSHIFCMNQPIPFHLSFVSSASSLASLLPLMPTTNKHYSPSKMCTRIQLLRQASVDVKNDYIPTGTKTEMWRVFSIGEGTFRRTGDGRDWISFAGEVNISPVKIGGFKAGGLWVKDCLVFSITPPDALRGPVGDLRQVIPVRIVTDPWAADGSTGLHVSPTGSEEYMDEQPGLSYYPD